jgi:hypothetical protein
MILARRGAQSGVVSPTNLLLASALMSLSYVAIRALMQRFAVNPILAKALVDGLLFVASFAIQRGFIFTKTTAEERA